MHLKILRLSIGLNFSNLKLGRREAAFNLLVERIPPKIPDIKLIQLGTISIFLCQN